MTVHTLIKLLRPYRGQGPGELVALPEAAALSLIRKGMACVASADLVSLYTGMTASRQPDTETETAAPAPEMAVTRLGTLR
jgi:hypothetical protein